MAQIVTTDKQWIFIDNSVEIPVYEIVCVNIRIDKDGVSIEPAGIVDILPALNISVGNSNRRGQYIGQTTIHYRDLGALNANITTVAPDNRVYNVDTALIGAIQTSTITVRITDIVVSYCTIVDTQLGLPVNRNSAAVSGCDVVDYQTVL